METAKEGSVLTRMDEERQALESFGIFSADEIPEHCLGVDRERNKKIVQAVIFDRLSMKPLSEKFGITASQVRTIAILCAMRASELMENRKKGFPYNLGLKPNVEYGLSDSGLTEKQVREKLATHKGRAEIMDIHGVGKHAIDEISRKLGLTPFAPKKAFGFTVSEEVYDSLYQQAKQSALD